MVEIDERSRSSTGLSKYSSKDSSKGSVTVTVKGIKMPHDSESNSTADMAPKPRFGITAQKLRWVILGLVLGTLAILALILGLFFGIFHKNHTAVATTTTAPGSVNIGLGHVSNTGLTVDLGYSTYTGMSVGNNISQWLGIRYAAAPVGDLRFRAPQDPPVDGKTYAATTRGKVCHSTPSMTLNTNRSEDCLFLNVFSPAQDTNLHPVYVFFQGGGLNDLSNPNLNGTSLVNASDHDIVVVTFNYRVGPWGFLASKEVQADGDLNVGLLDQRKVLHWIQTYIHLFGGDPKHVTIGGASAGGASVDLQMTAYGGRDDNLFHAAAAESQSFGPQLTVAESQYQYDALVSRVGCSKSTNTLQCLRDVDIKALASNNTNFPYPGTTGRAPIFMYSNTLDGNFTTDYTYNLFAAGKFVHVPSIFGDDTNEGTIFTPSNINNYPAVNSFLLANFPKLTPDQLSQIDTLYPNNGTTSSFPNRGPFWRTAADAYGEMRYNCPGLNISAAIASAGIPSYNYHWDVLSPNNAKNGMGVTHTAELGSIWGMSQGPDSTLVGVMQAYWTSFVRTGDPNTYKLADAPRWETFNGTTTTGIGMQRLHLVNSKVDIAMEPVDEGQKGRCAFLSGIGGAIGQ